MIKKMIIGAYILLNTLSFAEMKVKIHEPIRFRNINTKAYGELVVGQGALEVYSTDFESDIGKKIKIKLPEEGVMSNGKRNMKIEKFKMLKADEEFVIDREKRIVNIYAFTRRSELNKGDIDASEIEGEYAGSIPIVVEQYGQPLNPVPVPLPSFPDQENRPVVLPVFPDLEENILDNIW